MNLPELNLNFLLNITLIIVASLLMAAILLQQKGTGLGNIFGGGGGGEGNVYFKKRGMEKILFVATIVIAGLFILFSFLSLVI